MISDSVVTTKDSSSMYLLFPPMDEVGIKKDFSLCLGRTVQACKHRAWHHLEL